MIERVDRPVSETRLAATAQQLLEASMLCGIATVSVDGRAHANTAYFAWNREFELVWLSHPQARHSRNVRTNGSASILVYDSTQTWGKPDRGIQLFGSAQESSDEESAGAESMYADRFPDYVAADFRSYRFYLFRPRRLKLFEEAALGRGVFVTARLARGGHLAWERTEIYHADPAPASS